MGWRAPQLHATCCLALGAITLVEADGTPLPSCRVGGLSLPRTASSVASGHGWAIVMRDDRWFEAPGVVRGLAVQVQAEIVILRHQLNVLRRRMPSRARLTLIDRLIFVWLYRLRPSVLNAVVIVQPETVVRRHREGFRHCHAAARGGAGDRDGRSGDTGCARAALGRIRCE